MIENKSSIPYSYTRHKAKTSKKNNNNSHFQSLNIDFVLSLSFLHLSLKPKRVKCNNESHFLMLKIVFDSNKRLGSNKVVGTFFLIVWYIHMKRTIFFIKFRILEFPCPGMTHVTKLTRILLDHPACHPESLVPEDD